MTRADARRRAEEALAFMDAALRDEMPPLPTQVKALADAVRALLAAGPEAKTPPSDAVREAADRLSTYLPVWIAGGTGEDAQLRYRIENLLDALAARGGE